MQAFYYQMGNNPPILSVGPIAVGMTFTPGPITDSPYGSSGWPFTRGTVYTVTAIYPVTGQNAPKTSTSAHPGVHDGSDGGSLDVVTLSPAPADLTAANFGFPTGSIGTDMMKYLVRLS